MTDTDPVLDKAFAVLADAGHDVARITAAWSEPHRRYHSIDAHLTPMLADMYDLGRNFGLDSDDMFTLTEMVAYHDIVYTPRSAVGQNETLSATLYRQMAPARSDREMVATAIAGTVDHRRPVSFLAACLFDLDLARLHGPGYVTNGRLIRAEYGFDSDDDPAWLRDRARWIEAMLGRPTIFHTAWGARFETPARHNLAVDLRSIYRQLTHVLILDGSGDGRWQYTCACGLVITDPAALAEHHAGISRGWV